MNCVENHDLCVTAEEDPKDRNYIIIRETEDPNPEHFVRAPRQNFIDFVQAINDGKYDDLLMMPEPPVITEAEPLLQETSA